MQLPKRINGFRSKVINEIIDFLDSLQPLRSRSIKHDWTKHGIAYEITDISFSEDAAPKSFVCSLSANLLSPVVSITAGTVAIGDVNYSVSAGTVTLTGATEYVYVFHKKDHSASGFGHSSTRPTSAGDEWRFTLATYSGSGGTWTLVNTNHDGDIILPMPTA